jgi:hypothetical protein
LVATVNLDCRLDLKTIALHARNAEYNPKVRLVFFSCSPTDFVLGKPYDVMTCFLLFLFLQFGTETKKE